MNTRIKVASRLLNIDGGEVRITGFAKGAAMIGPNMATMLAFVLTDAIVEADALQRTVREAADYVVVSKLGAGAPVAERLDPRKRDRIT